jgi:glycosyltransferase involved in cell wall biosynthesis
MTVIYNGYDLSKFSFNEKERAALRQEWRITSRTPLIGMIARFNPEKDHENLIQALAILKREGWVNLRCVLVGTDMNQANQQLMDWLTGYDVHDLVLLAGPRIDVPLVMSAIDLNVLSSSSEGFPNVLAEAMAAGTPCVSTDVGDAAAILGDTGWIVPPRDPAALARAIAEALLETAQQDTWRVRQERARARVANHFEISRMVSKYHQIWGNSAES